MSTACTVIEGLRARIRDIERRPPSADRFVASGWDQVDAILPGGGFPRGALSELAGGHASGKTAIALATLASATRTRGLAAFIDGRHELYPPAAAALGVDLERLLVVRPHRSTRVEEARDALWAAEALLASGAFEAVVVDIALGREVACALGASSLDLALRRLRAAAEKGGAAGLWLGDPAGPRCPSAVRLECSRTAAGWLVRRDHARGAVERAGGAVTAVAPVHHAA